MTTTQIATVSATIVQAAIPNDLQRKGALVTQGGTNTSPGTSTLITGVAGLASILAVSVAISALAWAGSVVTVTTTTPHNWTVGDVVKVTVSGAAPTGYNGTFTATVTGASTLTYPLTVNPGAATSNGRVILAAVGELNQMVGTYFAGVGVPGVWVLELGEGQPAAGVTAIIAYLARVLHTPSQKYAYLVPREWSTETTFVTLTAQYTNPESMTYFYVTLAGPSEAAAFSSAKSVFAEVEAPSLPPTEFSLASAFGTVLSRAPSSANKVPPLSYAPSYGTTAYPIEGNQATFESLASINVGWIGTGAQGGIANNILFQGKLLSGLSWNFWYSTDWVQVNSAQALANEIINGSASSVNPLYYDQLGINRLQNRITQVFARGVGYGLGNGQVVATKLPVAAFQANYNAGDYNGKVVVNAEPFLAYSAENPLDYAAGKYAGLSGIWVPGNGFLNVFFNIQATDLIVV